MASNNGFALVIQKVKSGQAQISKEVSRSLAYARKLTDSATLKECKAQAAAILAYIAQQKDVTVEEYNAALKLKTGVEHRLGEVLAETVKHQPGPGRGKKSGDTTSPVLNGRIPPEITRKQSSRTQQLARLPWKEIEKRIDAKTETNERASQSRIVKELKQEQQRDENAKLVKACKPFLEIPGVFQTIVVDPPWDWGDEGDVSQMGRGRHEYTAMSFDELLKWPDIAKKSDKNCHLYLWITNRSLPKGFALLEAWGFRYVTCLTWCKPSVGMGNYFRGSTEHVLFGVRGSLGLLRKDVGTWFEAKRAGKHSAKPSEFYALVESCSPGPWANVFSRGNDRPGWTSWGAEV